MCGENKFFLSYLRCKCNGQEAPDEVDSKNEGYIKLLSQDKD